MPVWMNQRPRRLHFLGICLALAVSAPLGWWLLNQFFDLSAWPYLVYIYMLVSTGVTFGTLGYIAGKAQDLLYRLLERDSLTVLLNQRAFFRAMDQAYHLGVRYDDHVAVIMIDIDDFKAVNDNHNHLVGSELLKQIARTLVANSRDTDIVARYGGDEFIIGIPRVESIESAQILAERIRAKIEANVYEIRGVSIRVTVSLGVLITACHKSLKIEDLVQLADELLYKAKAEGKNRIETLIHAPDEHDLENVS